MSAEQVMPGIRYKRPIIAVFVLVALGLALAVVLHNNPLADPETERLKKICTCVLLALAVFVFTAFYDRWMILPVELFHSRRLIVRLSVNDFKKRYAGSYMGVVWALLQPVVTVAMYWFVFDRIMHARQEIAAADIEVPYVLFLTAGLVPWFYFQEALMNGTTALLEYNYLVKKVLFKISILPLIKIIAATFIHVFFIAVCLAVAAMYGYHPSLYTLQILYYGFCEFFLVLAICYTTCAVVVFFRDLTQIVAIALQLGTWATPILWDINGIGDQYKWIAKLNPMTYIVEGYRMSVYGQEWFWQHFYSSTYFWIVSVSLFLFGSLVFKRSKIHFADVL